MNVTKIPNVTLNPGDNFVPYAWTDAQTVHAHVTLPPPGPPAPGCDFAFGVEVTQAVIKDGVRGLTIRYTPPQPLPPPEGSPPPPDGEPLPPPPDGIVNGTLVVFEP